jgi:hypothetical protein
MNIQGLLAAVPNGTDQVTLPPGATLSPLMNMLMMGKFPDFNIVI